MRVNYKTIMIVVALAVQTRFLAPSGAQAEMAPDSQSEYAKTVAMLESAHRKGQLVGLDSKFFSSLNWVGRTATINYVCSSLPPERCHAAVALGLTDNALVVRDHALRMMISGRQFNPNEKKRAAEQIIADDRNYRRGRAFWIVDRAKSFLSASNDSKSH